MRQTCIGLPEFLGENVDAPRIAYNVMQTEHEVGTVGSPARQHDTKRRLHLQVKAAVGHLIIQVTHSLRVIGYIGGLAEVEHFKPRRPGRHRSADRKDALLDHTARRRPLEPRAQHRVALLQHQQRFQQQ